MTSPLNDPVGLAYLAGLIDGEGSVLMYRARSWRVPALRVVSTSRELLDYLAVRYAGSVGSQGKRDDRCKPCWAWQLGGPRATALMEAVLPYVRERAKRARISLILLDLPGVHTPAEQQAFEERFFGSQHRIVTSREVK